MYLVPKEAFEIYGGYQANDRPISRTLSYSHSTNNVIGDASGKINLDFELYLLILCVSRE